MCYNLDPEVVHLNAKNLSPERVQEVYASELKRLFQPAESTRQPPRNGHIEVITNEHDQPVLRVHDPQDPVPPYEERLKFELQREFSTMRYTRVNCDPDQFSVHVGPLPDTHDLYEDHAQFAEHDDFKENRSSGKNLRLQLRPTLYTRHTEVLIAMTMYNEDKVGRPVPSTSAPATSLRHCSPGSINTRR